MSEIAVVPDVAGAAAELFIEATAGAIAARGRAAVGLTGGSTASPLYAELVRSQKIPWDKLQIFFTDERAVPPDHELSNYRIARQELFDKTPIDSRQVHRLRGEAKDLEAEAQRAARESREALGIPPRLDLMLLGLGPDGHILSLFAGVPSSADRGDEELVRHVKAPEHVEPKVERITLTPFLLVTARTVVLQVKGASKAAVLAKAMKGANDLVGCPAQWLRKAAGRAVVVCDEEAAKDL
ncbi:MAG: 6-phosphogluconolactonase [Myxococcales bacterium]|nr:6-phosphogluconolactonase [Myxococcales bacterium]